MARDEPQINLRIPAELKLDLVRESFIHKRTLTAEIVSRLQASVQDKGDSAQLRQEVEQLRESLAATKYAAGVLDISQWMLAQALVLCYEKLSETAKRDAVLTNGVQMAKALLERDHPGLVDALISTFSDDVELATAMTKAKDKMAKARRPADDLTPP